MLCFFAFVLQFGTFSCTCDCMQVINKLLGVHNSLFFALLCYNHVFCMALNIVSMSYVMAKKDVCMIEFIDKVKQILIVHDSMKRC